MSIKKATACLMMLVAAGFTLAATGCSHSPPKTTPELSKLEGKKVALVETEGEATARKIVETALVNQLIKRGTFILLSKQEVEAARVAPQQDPMDWKGIARRAGADYALRAKVLQFDATEAKGYSSEEVYDSQLAAEQGEENGKTQRLYPVKSLSAHVRVQLDFTRLEDGESRTAIAEREEIVKAEAKTAAAHLPPRLRFLESVSNEAFRRFFEQNY